MTYNDDGSKWLGVYDKAEDWGGNPHWAKKDRSAHIFLYIQDDDHFWLIDDREQNTNDKTQNWYSGGWIPSPTGSTADLFV